MPQCYVKKVFLLVYGLALAVQERLPKGIVVPEDAGIQDEKHTAWRHDLAVAGGLHDAADRLLQVVNSEGGRPTMWHAVGLARMLTCIENTYTLAVLVHHLQNSHAFRGVSDVGATVRFHHQVNVLSDKVINNPNNLVSSHG